MKFTNEDLLKAMGLQVGDKIKVKGYSGIFEVMNSHEGVLRIVENNTSLAGIDWLLNEEYEILPRPKRIGDLACSDLECKNCPLKMLCRIAEVGYFSKCTLYEALDDLLKNDVQPDYFDQEIYDLFKARLDVFVDV